MSKVEVNTIEPQCGTTLTVGKCTTSVAVPGNVVKSNALQASDGGNIVSQSGTDITLGASGDTINLASGASQSGFGRTGTVDWQTGDIKTGDFTGATGKGYFVNTTSGEITATLPASPSAGDIVGLKDYALTFDTNSMFIGRNSEPINGGTGTTLEISTEGATIMLVYVDGVKGWVPTQDDASAITAVTPAFVAATGGTPCAGAVVCTDYKTHTFTGPGTLCVSSAGNAYGSNAISYVILAGGGEGGSSNPSNGAGGGGAGGYRESKAPFCSYTAAPPAATGGFAVAATGYPIVVGAGGALQPNAGAANANPGSDSTGFSLTATGGGGAKGDFPYSEPTTVADGGSGGGGGTGSTASRLVAGNGNEPPVSPPQGTPGGDGFYPSTYAGGGGGGATVAGTTSTCGVAGPGGAGATTEITASPVAYGGGAGASITSAGCGGAGGTGGGGAGGNLSGAAASGTVNKGGGGGGGGWPSPSYNRGGGGSGVVIIRYKFQ